jgi:uncharacterized membrane protein
MVKTGRHLWAQHPHVDNDLTLGERWADRLKAGFGTWWFLGILNGLFFTWVVVDAVSGNRIDPGLFYANLFLSWLAGQQGGALQIAANRGDKKAGELALSTHANGETLLDLNRQQMTILNELRSLRAEVAEQVEGRHGR